MPSRLALRLWTAHLLLRLQPDPSIMSLHCVMYKSMQKSFVEVSSAAHSAFMSPIELFSDNIVAVITIQSSTTKIWCHSTCCIADLCISMQVSTATARASISVLLNFQHVNQPASAMMSASRCQKVSRTCDDMLRRNLMRFLLFWLPERGNQKGDYAESSQPLEQAGLLLGDWLAEEKCEVCLSQAAVLMN